MKVQFLIDNKKSWIISFIKNFIIRNKQKYNLSLIHNHNSIKKSDITFILSSLKKISPSNLKKSKNNIVIHPSKLPKGKGFSPLEWQVLEGKNKIWITAIEANNNFDSGEIYYQNSFLLKGTELKNDLKKIQFKETLKIIKKIIHKYPKLKSFKQSGTSTYFKKRGKWSNELDINKTIKKQINILRISDNHNYPPFFIYKNKKYILKIFNDKK